MAVAEALTPPQKFWRVRIFALTWLAYAGFYLCRKNLSVTMPLMSAEQHYSKMQLANIIFGYSLLYATGQFFFGVLADKFGSRMVVTLGLCTAVLSNFLLGLSTSANMLIFFACINGAGQSAGWPGLVKNMASWFRHGERGVVMAWWTTNYVVGGFAGTLFATFVVTTPWLLPALGWRRGFWIPAAALLLIALVFFALVRNRPSEAGVTDIVENDGELANNRKSAHSDGEFMRTLRTYLLMLGDWEVWVVAIGALFSKVTRYSFMFWLPLYLAEQLKYSAREAGNTSSLFELAGFGGALLGGYVSDKFMQSRRLPVAAVMMWGLALACWVHPTMAGYGKLGVALSICLIGIMNYGPDTLMQGAASQDVGAKWGVGTASGFVDGVSSVGQMLSAYLVAYIAEHYGWDRLFYVFVALAFVGGCVMASRWRNLSAQSLAQLDLQKVVTSKPASDLLP